MKATFLGATHEVTGSCTLIEVGNCRFLVDCGMEQGKDIFVNQEIPVNPGAIDFILLTHAHIDHSGKIPLLCKNGFSGSIYATGATSSLVSIMLRDSAHIQMFEAEWRNRKAKRSGGEPYEPLYTTDDAEEAIKLLCPCDYGMKFTINENVSVRFNDIGHLLGSSAIEIFLSENGIDKKIVFSGDVGNVHRPIIRDPQKVEGGDYAVIESTYGDRYHESEPDYIHTLADCIQRTFDRGGNVVIPCFAVGRTQEILYFLRDIKENNLIKGHDNFPVYVDSPLAVEATNIFMRCDTSYFDEETKALINKGINPITFNGLRLSITSEDSKAINFDPTPKVILSASGMCEAGRIRHHLKHNIWRKECLVLFVGYQSEGTLGRIIHDGAPVVKLFGEEIEVNAEITYLKGISGHADKNGLINWIESFDKKPQKVFVNHGENEVCEDFARCLKEEHGYNTLAPFSGTCYDLAADMPIILTNGIPVEKSEAPTKRAEMVFSRLISSAGNLATIAKSCRGMSNKDLAKFASQIDELCKKWKK